MELRDPGFMHLEDFSDPLHAEFLLIVQLNHCAMPAREAGNGLGEIPFHFFPLALDFRIVSNPAEQSPQSGPLRHPLYICEVRSDID